MGVGVKHKVNGTNPNHRLIPAGRFISKPDPGKEGSKIFVQRIARRNGGCCCEMLDGPGQTERLID